jgi:FkbM family methyltransferase
MDIKQNKKNYKNQLISKSDFINEMHDLHKVLFDFSVNLKNSEIAKIELNDEGVFFTSRATKFHNGEVKFFINVLDKRGAPTEAFNFGNYEKEVSQAIFNLVKDGDIVFDIGANIGWYSFHLAQKLSKSIIHAFEPISETFIRLERNMELNQIANVKLNNLAFSAKKEKIKFYHSPDLTVAASARNITESKNVLQSECDSDLLDNYVNLNKIDRLDFIKCDVEGAEYFVFQGGIETLKNYKPIVLTEMLRKWSEKFGYHPNDIIKFFATLDYSCFTLNMGKISLIQEITPKTMETNYLFLHTKKHEQLIFDLS